MSRGSSPSLMNSLLAFPSALYRAGVRLRLWAYEARLVGKRSLPGFVLSVGNLTAGGTGKTPAVVMLARWAQSQGYRVAVLSRGYGGSYRSKVLEVSDGERIKAEAGEAGDEPYLLAKNLHGVPIALSKRRILAGRYVREKFGSDFFILDDGFQHLELKRDLNLLLMDAGNPFGGGHLLPRGSLREPLDQLARADAFLLTRFKGDAPGEETRAYLQKKFPEIPVFCSDHLPDKVVVPYTQELYDPDFLKGKDVLAFAGIARPELFQETLEGLGTKVVHFQRFRDHHRYSEREILGLLRLKERLGAQYMVTTEKDWCRGSFQPASDPRMAYLQIRFSMVSGDKAFFQLILNRLHSTLDPRR